MLIWFASSEHHTLVGEIHGLRAGERRLDCKDCTRFEQVHVEKVDSYANLLREQKRLLSEGKTDEAKRLDEQILKAQAEKEASLANLTTHRNSHLYPD